MSVARFRSSEVTRAIKAARAAGLDAFDVVIGHEGTPIVRVRPKAANDTPQDILDEIEALRREIQDDAA